MMYNIMMDNNGEWVCEDSVKGDCDHEECERVRNLMGEKCIVCGRVIKVGERYYGDEKGKLNHTSCAIGIWEIYR